MNNQTARIEESWIPKQLALLIIFCSTLFFSAALIFWLEPLISKMILPYLGGSPSVWNVCLVFFQASLLAGYYYAHLIGNNLSIKKQAIIHIILLAFALLFLPISLKEVNLLNEFYPVSSLLIVLFISIGLPFFVLSGTAPLLQQWFSLTLHPSANDPYFLYAASNLGSLVALLSFPFLLEPNFTLNHQSNFWFYIYILLMALIVFCAVFVCSPQLNKAALQQKYAIRNKIENNSSDIPYKQKLYWLALSFVPSSLLLGVTTYMTTDVTSVPLFWIIPLTLYLLSFIITFSRKPIIPHKISVHIQFWLLVPFLYAFVFFYQITYIGLIFAIHLLMFFFTALVCNGELIKCRPQVQHLTQFYLWIALGGVLGGIFNAVIAPVIFNNVYEYPVVIALACMLRPNFSKPNIPKISPFDLIIPLAIVCFFYITSISFHFVDTTNALRYLPLCFILAAIVVFSFPERPFRFGLGIGSLLLSAIILLNPTNNKNLLIERNFFGTIKVQEDSKANVHILVDNTTIHGAQFYGNLAQDQSQLKPLHHFNLCSNNTEEQILGIDTISRLYDKNAVTYYVPVQEILSSLRDNKPNLHVAIAGLGTGTLACFARPRDQFTFYEINPAMVNIASNRRYFTYLSDCPPHALIYGDARLMMKNAPAYTYDLIILDAFSSDAIPLHLLTQEALELYLSKLNPDGVLAFNISSRHLDLRYVLSALAQSLHLVALIHVDMQSNPQAYKFPSIWVVMARNQMALGDIGNNPEWKLLPPSDTKNVWTDNFSNMAGIIEG